MRGEVPTVVETRISGMIARAVAEEREACARVMDGMAEEEHAVFVNPEAERLMRLAVLVARRGASAIRARGAA